MLSGLCKAGDGREWLAVLAEGDEGGAGCGDDYGGGLSAGILSAQDTVFNGTEVAHAGGVVAGRGCTRSVADHHGPAGYTCKAEEVSAFGRAD